LTESTGAARGIAGALFVLFYLVRAVGDGTEPSGQSSLIWLSPIGWIQLVQPFASVRWGVFALFLGAVVVLIAAAFVLCSRRDVGAGIIQPRLGPTKGSPHLGSPLALSWRLQRRSLSAWAILLALYGILIGYLAKTSANLLATNVQLAKVFALFGGASAYTDTLFTFSLTFAGWIAAAYAIAATLQLQSEEAERRVDPVLASSVSKLRWAGSELVLVVIGSATVLAAFGLLGGLTYGLSTSNVGYELPRVLTAALAYLPAVLVMVGIAVALYGILPRFAYLSWAALAAFVGIEIIGETLKVSQAILDISPFAHVPAVLVNGLSLMPLVSLTLLAVVLTAAGLLAFQHRSVG
jgi:ABC-2 type transport system permease protein